MVVRVVARLSSAGGSICCLVNNTVLITCQVNMVTPCTEAILIWHLQAGRCIGCLGWALRMPCQSDWVAVLHAWLCRLNWLAVLHAWLCKFHWVAALHAWLCRLDWVAVLHAWPCKFDWVAVPHAWPCRFDWVALVLHACSHLYAPLGSVGAAFLFAPYSILPSWHKLRRNLEDVIISRPCLASLLLMAHY